MSRKDQKLSYLSEVPMFSALTQTELRTVGRLTDKIAVKEGKVLCEEGTTGHEFFLVIDGQASVKRGRKVIATLEAGDYFGELSLLDGGERSATVAAATDLEVLVIGQKEFTAILRELPAVSRKFLSAMATRLRASDKKALSNN